MTRKNNLLLGFMVTFLKISLSFLTYPLYLHYLNSFDLSLYFLFISTGAILDVLDFGFSGNLTRYFSYAYAGAISINQGKSRQLLGSNNSPNHNLMVELIEFSRIYYKILSLVTLVFVVLGFSGYLYYFCSLHQQAFLRVVAIWFVYALSTLLGVYYMYLSPFLIGMGYIDKVNKVIFSSKVSGVLFQVFFLFCGYGLLSIAMGAVVATVIERILLLHIVKKILISVRQYTTPKAFVSLFKDLWKLNYKFGLTSLSAIFIVKATTFMAGIAIHDIATLSEYLLTFQVFTVILTLATVPIRNNSADIAAYHITNPKLSFKMFLHANRKSMLVFITLACGILLFGNQVLQLLHFKHVLLPSKYLLLFVLIYALENQLGNHLTMIVNRNEIPHFVSYQVTAFSVFGLLIIFSFVFKLGIWGLLLPQLLCQLAFNYWYWVKYNLTQASFSVSCYLKTLFRSNIVST